MWSNFHTHSHYCDGKGFIRNYLEAATKVGMSHLGFSSHAPLPFPCKWCMRSDAFDLYVEEIESAREHYPGIEIYKGLEIDFIPDTISPLDFSSNLDYTIGSIHFVESFHGKHWEIDNTLEVFKEGLEKIFRNDIRAAIHRYYELTRHMILTAPPDILGHLDKIKINSADIYFEESETWYREEVDKTLMAIQHSKAIVEVNTRGLYKKKSATTYPSPWILDRIHAAKIPITLCSDAHHPDDLTREFSSVLGMLRDVGFKNLSILKGGTWKDVSLDEYGPDH